MFNKLQKSKYQGTILSILIPVTNRFINFAFYPIIYGNFDSVGFVEYNMFSSISFLLSIILELGIKQKILNHSNNQLNLNGYLLRIIYVSIFLAAIGLFTKFINFSNAHTSLFVLYLLAVADASTNIMISSVILTSVLKSKDKKTYAIFTTFTFLFPAIIKLVTLYLIKIDMNHFLILCIAVKLPIIIFGNYYVTKSFKMLFTFWSNKQTYNFFDYYSTNVSLSLMTAAIASIDKIFGLLIFSTKQMATYMILIQVISFLNGISEQWILLHRIRIYNLLNRIDILNYLKILRIVIILITFSTFLLTCAIDKFTRSNFFLTELPLALLYCIAWFIYVVINFYVNYLHFNLRNYLKNHFFGLCIAATLFGILLLSKTFSVLYLGFIPAIGIAGIVILNLKTLELNLSSNN